MGGRERLPFAARGQRADIGQCSARTNPGYGLLYHATVQRVGDCHGCGQRQRAPTASRPTFPEQHQKQQCVGDVEIPNLADKRHHQIKHGVGGSMVDEIEQPDIALLEKFRHGSTVVSGRENGKGIILLFAGSPSSVFAVYQMLHRVFQPGEAGWKTGQEYTSVPNKLVCENLSTLRYCSLS